MPKVLTAKAVAQMKPGAKRREICDGGARGLYLYVQPTGAKSWVMPLGSKKLKLGPVDLSGRETTCTPTLGTPLTLAAARWLAAEVRRRVAAGEDVIRTPQVAAPTFAAVAVQFIEEYAKPHTRRWQETAHILGVKGDTLIKGGLAEHWRAKLITAVTSDDIYRAIDAARRRRSRVTDAAPAPLSNSRGRGLARTLSKLFSWALQHRMITANPCIGVWVPPAPKSRDRVLTDDEIIRFWRAADEPWLKLLLLTGARLREVAGMRYDELESEHALTWTIPGTRTKNHKALSLALPPLACDIIACVERLEGSPFVFTTTGRTPVSGFSKIKRRLDAQMGPVGQPWRLHDLRRTAATGMATLGIAPHVVEAVINHISGAKAGVAGVYNRAEYGPEKAAALQRWANHVEGLVSGKASNVTALRG